LYKLWTTAIHWAKPYDAEVFIITSLFGTENSTGRQITEGEKNLNAAGSYLEEQGIKYQKHFLIQGKRPGEDIVDFARKHDRD
jgi:hypothetical protein